MTMIETTTSAAICPLMPRRFKKPNSFMTGRSCSGGNRLPSYRVHRGGEHIAAGAYRLDHGGVLRIGFDPAPDAADQHVDAALEGAGVAALGKIEQAVARQHPAGSLAEGAQQVEF